MRFVQHACRWVMENRETWYEGIWLLPGEQCPHCGKTASDQNARWIFVDTEEKRRLSLPYCHFILRSPNDFDNGRFPFKLDKENGLVVTREQTYSLNAPESGLDVRLNYKLSNAEAIALLGLLISTLKISEEVNQDPHLAGEAWYHSEWPK